MRTHRGPTGDGGEVRRSDTGGTAYAANGYSLHDINWLFLGLIRVSLALLQNDDTGVGVYLVVRSGVRKL
jgi:hypothetical protein